MIEVVGPTPAGAKVMAVLCVFYIIGVLWWYARGPQD